MLRWGTAGGFLSGGYENDTHTTGFGTSDNIFGTVPRVVSPSCPKGTALVGDWSQLRLYVREQMRLDVDHQQGGEFAVASCLGAPWTTIPVRSCAPGFSPRRWRSTRL